MSLTQYVWKTDNSAQEYEVNMTDSFHSSRREIKIDQAIAGDLRGNNFSNHQFIRLVAKKKKFVECDFRFSEFSAAYLRHCSFDSCDFTGCKFTDSNLRGSSFIGCKFDYAEFSSTHIEPEIMDNGCPAQENLQLIFARSLRLNFHQVGDADAANKAIRIELAATRVHLKKAWRSKESYYRDKYRDLKRLGMFFKWLKFSMLDMFWGNGESAAKLFRSLIILMLLISSAHIISTDSVLDILSYPGFILQSPAILLNIEHPPSFPNWSLAGIAMIRYVLVACLVSILIKRLSRR